MKIDEPLFRQTMRLWATGVTIVTSGDDANRHGMTVSSFTSVSVTPPVVCVSINTQARTHQLIASTGNFGVTILAEDQGSLSDCFAGRVADEGDRFYGVDTFKLETGTPLLEGGLAWFDCKVVGKLEFGGNTVFFGEVVAVKSNDSVKPLLYANRAYQSLQK